MKNILRMVEMDINSNRLVGVDIEDTYLTNRHEKLNKNMPLAGHDTAPHGMIAAAMEISYGDTEQKNSKDVLLE